MTAAEASSWFSLSGVCLDLLSGIVLAREVWRPVPRGDDAAGAEALLAELATAVASGDRAAARAIAQRCGALALGATAGRVTDGWRSQLLGRWGQAGLGLFIAGALLQVIGAVVGLSK